MMEFYINTRVDFCLNCSSLSYGMLMRPQSGRNRNPTPIIYQVLHYESEPLVECVAVSRQWICQKGGGSDMIGLIGLLVANNMYDCAYEGTSKE